MPAIVLLAALLMIWELFVAITHQPRYILPPLHEVLATAYQSAGDVFLPAVWTTLREMLYGFFLGSAIGFLIGVLCAEIGLFRRAVLPLVITSQAIPVIAIAPMLILWFGFGMAPKIVVVALISFFPVTVSTLSGLASTDADAMRLMTSLGATRLQKLFLLRVPAALPFVLSGLKTAAAISAIGAIVGEWVGAESGLGPVMIAANSGFQTDISFAAIVYLSILAVGMFLAVSAVEWLLFRWQRTN